MPFVPGEEYDALRNQNQRLSVELQVFDDLRPYLHLAVELKIALTEAIDTNPELTASQIGDLAFHRVLEHSLDQARDEVVTEYEQQHRRELYERVVEEVKAAEGDQILADVQTKIDTDPELACELRNSVRRELGARAMDVARQQLSEEQKEAIEAEAERQLALDRFDVELAIEGELDLSRDDLKKMLSPGDTIDLYYTDARDRQVKLVLKWTRDVKDHEGWVFSGSDSSLCHRDGSSFSLSGSKFVRVGTLQSDLSDGDKVVVSDLLTVGMPIALSQGQRKDNPEQHVPHSSAGAYYDKVPAILKGIDLKTKDLKFFNGDS